MTINFKLGQMENRQASVVDHKLESRPQEGGKRKVIFLTVGVENNNGPEILCKMIDRCAGRKAEKKAV